MAVKKDQNPKLRIKLKSYDVRMLESAVGKVISLLIKSGAQVKGPIPLPKKRKVYTVLRSNFKFKSSREQFERISYTRIIDVTEMWAKTVEYLQNLSIPINKFVEIQTFNWFQFVKPCILNEDLLLQKKKWQDYGLMVKWSQLQWLKFCLKKS